MVASRFSQNAEANVVTHPADVGDHRPQHHHLRRLHRAIPEVTWSIYWKIMLAAAIACALCIVLFEVWLAASRRDWRSRFSIR
jgi:hypothetical protein